MTAPRRDNGASSGRARSSGVRRVADRIARVPNSGIRAVVERAGPDAINLATGDPAFASPPAAVQAAITAMRDEQTHYTSTRGTARLRAAWADDLQQRTGVVIDADRELLVTSGAMNALAAVMFALVDSDDEVLLPDPGFTNYRPHVLLAGGVPRGYSLPAGRGFVPDPDEVASLLTPRTRVLLLNSPSNPTGGVIDGDTLAALVDVATEAGVAVVSDEAYRDVLHDGVQHVHAATLAADRPAPVISIHSHSKSYAMTGWRVGFLSGPADVVDAVATVQEHVIGCASSVSQAAATGALLDPDGPRLAAERMTVLRRNRQAALDVLDGIDGVDLVAPAGALYAFPHVGDGTGIAEALAADHDVLVVPGAAFGEVGAGHVRIAFSLAPDELDEGLSRLHRGLTELLPSTHLTET